MFLQERGAFTLVLSGGSLFKALSPLIGLPGLDLSKWHVFFVDERNVPHSSPDSNFKGAFEVLLSKVPTGASILGLLHLQQPADMRIVCMNTPHMHGKVAGLPSQSCEILGTRIACICTKGAQFHNGGPTVYVPVPRGETCV